MDGTLITIITIIQERCVQLELVVMYENDNFIVYTQDSKVVVRNKATHIVELETVNLYDALVHAKLHDRWMTKFYDTENAVTEDGEEYDDSEEAPDVGKMH